MFYIFVRDEGQILLYVYLGILNPFIFTPKLEELCGYCFHPWRPDWLVGKRQENACPGCISEVVRCSILIPGRDIDWGV